MVIMYTHKHTYHALESYVFKIVEHFFKAIGSNEAVPQKLKRESSSGKSHSGITKIC